MEPKSDLEHAVVLERANSACEQLRTGAPRLVYGAARHVLCTPCVPNFLVAHNAPLVEHGGVAWCVGPLALCACRAVRA